MSLRHKVIGRKLTNLVTSVSVLLVGTLLAPCLHAHHEAIFGPQSSTLISRKRFVSVQYYLTNEGRRPMPRSRSHIGILSVGTSLGNRWSVSATLPFEAERGTPEENPTGVQDVVVGIRYFFEPAGDQTLMAVLTFEPPTGNLEHRAIGVGGGLIYGREWRPWSVIVYGLGRTESSLEAGEKRGNRLFLGGGLAYEKAVLPFSPQLGISWERTGRRREQGLLVPTSNSSALMLHPTLSRTFADEAVQTFFVVSVPVAQRSGNEGWQRFRIAAGIVWEF